MAHVAVHKKACQLYIDFITQCPTISALLHCTGLCIARLLRWSGQRGAGGLGALLGLEQHKLVLKAQSDMQTMPRFEDAKGAMECRSGVAVPHCAGGGVHAGQCHGVGGSPGEHRQRGMVGDEANLWCCVHSVHSVPGHTSPTTESPLPAAQTSPHDCMAMQLWVRPTPCLRTEVR